MHTRILILGSGPAGWTAGIYAARAGLETTLLTGPTAGGQLMLTHEIENFPGFLKISGIDLMSEFQKQAESLGVRVKYEMATRIDFSKKPFIITTEMGAEWTADALIIATGSSPKWLNVPGEETFKGKGISICATCDGFFYRKKHVAVIGGGNSAVYEALFLSEVADRVTLIHRGSHLRADKVLTEKLMQNPKITVLWDTVVQEFIGEEKLKRLKLFHQIERKESFLDIDGTFVAIGNHPNTDLFQNQLDLDEYGYIKTTFGQKTSVPGVFACGDVQEPVFRQAIIAAGTGCVAALSAEKFLIG